MYILYSTKDKQSTHLFHQPLACVAVTVNRQDQISAAFLAIPCNQSSNLNFYLSGNKYLQCLCHLKYTFINVCRSETRRRQFKQTPTEQLEYLVSLVRLKPPLPRESINRKRSWLKQHLSRQKSKQKVLMSWVAATNKLPYPRLWVISTGESYRRILSYEEEMEGKFIIQTDRDRRQSLDVLRGKKRWLKFN